jgi:hypothetical protein
MKSFLFFLTLFFNFLFFHFVLLLSFAIILLIHTLFLLQFFFSRYIAFTTLSKPSIATKQTIKHIASKWDRFRIRLQTRKIGKLLWILNRKSRRVYHRNQKELNSDIYFIPNKCKNVN